MKPYKTPHRKTKLPEAYTKYPYGLVEVLIWRPSKVAGERTGTRFSSGFKGWVNKRDLRDVRTELGENETWSWAGFSVNDFNSWYLESQESTPPEIKQVIEQLWDWLEGVGE